MSVFATADFFIKPDRVDELLQILQGALPDTRAFEGCERIDTFVDLDEPGHILLFEQWTERAAHQKYLGWRQEQGMFELLADFVTAPPSVPVLRPPRRRLTAAHRRRTSRSRCGFIAIATTGRCERRSRSVRRRGSPVLMAGARPRLRPAKRAVGMVRRTRGDGPRPAKRRLLDETVPASTSLDPMLESRSQRSNIP